MIQTWNFDLALTPKQLQTWMLVFNLNLHWIYIDLQGSHSCKFEFTLNLKQIQTYKFEFTLNLKQIQTGKLEFTLNLKQIQT